jgi:hypothetical protein
MSLMAATCTSTRDGVTSHAPSTSVMGSLLYCDMMVGHRLMSRSSTLPSVVSSTRTTSRPVVISSPYPSWSRGVCSDPEEVPP